MNTKIYKFLFFAFIIFTISNYTAALKLPKINTEVIDILNKYNETVSKYENLTTIYNSLKDSEINTTLSNTKKSLDSEINEVKQYITNIKNLAENTDDKAKDSLLEKTGNKLLEVNKTLDTFENELNKYKNLDQ
ncbi:MAG: hypothetical protein SVN78_09065 [Deferribacterota bacterium]|nr:hypothetical protein [Deferribacterota bacterium]